MIRIAMMALSRTIRAGKPRADGRSFINGGEDVTSDVLKAIIEYVGVGGVHVVYENGKPKYEIEVREFVDVPKDDGNSTNPWKHYAQHLHVCCDCWGDAKATCAEGIRLFRTASGEGL